MIIKTRDFGEIDISSSEIITFVKPVFGFEDYKKFIVINDTSIGTDIMWLQCVEEENICFVVINPFSVFDKYNPIVTKQQMECIGATSEKDITYATIAVIPHNIKDTTVNLKSPIIINHKDKKAMQIILEEDYKIKYKVYKENK